MFCFVFVFYIMNGPQVCLPSALKIFVTGDSETNSLKKACLMATHDSNPLNIRTEVQAE